MDSQQLIDMILAEEAAGFSVAPKDDCPHISDESFKIDDELITPPGPFVPSSSHGKAVMEQTPTQNIYTQRMKCSYEPCDVNEEIWVCLKCGIGACGRYKRQHMLEHASNQSSSSCAPVVAISLSDLSFWCFTCDSYITHPKLEQPFREFHNAKIGRYPDASLHVPSSTSLVLEEQ